VTERERIHQVINQLHLPHGFVISGSAVLFLHCLDRAKPMGDLDIFIPTRTWFALMSTGEWDVWTTDPADPARRVDPPYLVKIVDGLEVNVFFQWRKRGVGDIDVAFWLHNSEEVDGLPCIPLQFILDWKREVGRAKDVDDIALLERHLKDAA
jgi:hypothetical protein